MTAFPSCYLGPSVTVTEEEFNLFHTIDRNLFTLLVANLGRDLAESMQVMALWLWFEHTGYCRSLVKKLLDLPYTIINSLADEAILCLACIERDNFPLNSDNTELSLTQNFSQKEISLRIFYGIRVTVIGGVAQIVNDVCTRAFRDILKNILGSNGGRPVLPKLYHNFTNNNEQNHVSNLVGGSLEQSFYGPILGFPMFGNPNIGFVPYPRINTTGYGSSRHAIPNIPPLPVIPNMGPMDHRTIKDGLANVQQISRAFVEYDLSCQRHKLSNELHDLMANLNLSNNNNDGVQQEEERMELTVPAHDRTIFLTFSKGYPISEHEVRDFVTRRYGDCIEAVYMQEVGPEKQVLYARLVVKTSELIRVVLEGQSKAKFSINGKHVWARKYVSKQHSAPANGANSFRAGAGPTSPKKRQGKGILRE